MCSRVQLFNQHHCPLLRLHLSNADISELMLLTLALMPFSLSSNVNACSHSLPFGRNEAHHILARCDGRTDADNIFWRGTNGYSHSPSFSHADMADLKLIAVAVMPKIANLVKQCHYLPLLIALAHLVKQHECLLRLPSHLAR